MNSELMRMKSRELEASPLKSSKEGWKIEQNGNSPIIFNERGISSTHQDCFIHWEDISKIRYEHSYFFQSRLKLKGKSGNSIEIDITGHGLGTFGIFLSEKAPGHYEDIKSYLTKWYKFPVLPVHAPEHSELVTISDDQYRIRHPRFNDKSVTVEFNFFYRKKSLRKR
ncbi:MAG: hypothetical protein ABEJ65_04230 [bacterium]